MTTLAERILYCASWACDIREVCACSSFVPFNCLSFGAGTGVRVEVDGGCEEGQYGGQAWEDEDVNACHDPKWGNFL